MPVMKMPVIDCPIDCGAPCKTPRDSPCVYDYPSPENSLIYIYSNDGNTLITTIDMWYTPDEMNLPTIYFKNGYGDFPPGFYFIYGSAGYICRYDKPDNIEGYSISPNSTTVDIADGHEFAINTIHTIYEVPKSEPTGNTLDVTYNSQKIIDSLEVTPPVTVTYNGNTIATLNVGDTKTLQCNGKVMASDVVIGDKTLQCNGKLMASDVVVEVGGG